MKEAEKSYTLQYIYDWIKVNFYIQLLLPNLILSLLASNQFINLH